jgi:glucose/arabinose dehydrogenase
MATILGGSGADALAGTPDADLILGFDPDGPTNQVATIEAIRVAAGLSQPVFATAPPDDPDRLALVERAGRIQTLDLRSGAVAPTAFLDLSGQVATAGEEGLLGLAFHPAYAANGRFYVYLSNLAGDSEVREYRAVAGDPNRADPASERLILRIDQPDAFSNHKGGWIGFGPDGMLYVATGDGGGGGDPFGNGQNPNTLLGKILRLDVGGADAFPADPARNYAIPPDNPFAASGGGAPENWALGLRNPWRASFDRATGTLWIGDVGQARFEEIDLGIAGANYGWNQFEGFASFVPGAASAGLVPPLFAYGREFGGAISGGYVYRGPEDGLQGAYLFADSVSGRVFSLTRDAAGAPVVAERTGQLAFVAGGALNSPVSFGEDAEGQLYVIDIDGEVFRLAPRALAADLGDRLEGGEGADGLYAGAGDDVVLGGAGPDHLFGMAGNDALAGGPGTDRLWGGAGNDRLAGGPAADWVSGGGGTDTLVLSGARADYDVLLAGGTSTVADRRAGGDGVDQASSVEVLRFADGWLALDGRTPVGSALRLYEAALGREPDPAGLGFWAGALEAGRITLAEAARSFVASPEFQARYGAPDNAGFVDLLYRNALGRSPDAEGLAYWTGALNAGAITRAEAVLGFSESAELVAATAAPFAVGVFAPAPVADGLAFI